MDHYSGQGNKNNPRSTDFKYCIIPFILMWKMEYCENRLSSQCNHRYVISMRFRIISIISDRYFCRLKLDKRTVDTAENKSNQDKRRAIFQDIIGSEGAAVTILHYIGSAMQRRQWSPSPFLSRSQSPTTIGSQIRINLATLRPLRCCVYV